MKKRKLHITERYFIKNSNNLRARQLTTEFLGLDQRKCKLPLNKCSTSLLKFISNYNELVTNAKVKEKDGQESLF